MIESGLDVEGSVRSNKGKVMAKASLKLTNGTIVSIEGSPEEVHRILDLHSGEIASSHKPEITSKTKMSPRPLNPKGNESVIDLKEIINKVKSCDEAENIEKQILDRTSMADRTLLPLYIVHEYFGNSQGLTSGEISKVIADLGIPIKISNVSRTLSGTASKYVNGHSVRKKGIAVRYKLIRRGAQYFKDVITKSTNVE